MHKVLIVDDDELIRKLFRELLELNGFSYIEAACGMDALGIFRDNRPEAVLLDLRMPGMDGIETMKELRLIDRDIPVIFVTGIADIDTAVETIKLGAYDFIVKPPKIDRLIFTLKRAVDNLELTRSFKENERDITERKRLDAELKSSNDMLRTLAAHLEAAREEERIRIAREVHDELGQLLAKLNIDLFGLNAAIKGSKAEEKAQLLEKTDIISKGIGLLADKVHTIATELRPGILDQLGLTAAIEWQAGEFQKQNDIRCGFEVKGDINVDDAVSTALFRILQEALTNIVRHANATKVELRLSKEDGLVCLEIADNGWGISEEELRDVNSIGLLGMKERAHALGGSVDISGRVGAGTTVTVRIPVKE